MTKSLLQLSTIISPFPQITFKYTNISIPKSFSIVVDDHMSDVNQLVAYIFTKISHYRNVSILYLTQNLFDKNKYARTISLNAHYLVLFKIVEMLDNLQFLRDRCIRHVGSLP